MYNAGFKIELPSVISIKKTNMLNVQSLIQPQRSQTRRDDKKQTLEQFSKSWLKKKKILILTDVWLDIQTFSKQKKTPPYSISSHSYLHKFQLKGET